MFALSPTELQAAMQADVDAGLVPLFLCATVGTTQTTPVDPIRELCAVAATHGVWVHVDAAYAGSALVCPEFRHLIDGAEAVDSFSMNAHKWLLANNDCCVLWVKKPSLLIAALSMEQEYILNAGEAHGLPHPQQLLGESERREAADQRGRRRRREVPQDSVPVRAQICDELPRLAGGVGAGGLPGAREGVEEGDVAAEEVLRVREEVGAVGQGAEEVERRERVRGELRGRDAPLAA